MTPDPKHRLIVVVGSLHYDLIVAAPDRPRKGETLAGSHWAQKCGGKGGNQAVAAARQQVPVAMIGATGDDAAGAILRANLQANGIDCSAVGCLADQPSGMSVAIFDSEGDYGAVIVSGSNLALDARTIERDGASIDRASVVVLQNEIPDAANFAAVRRAKSAGAITVLNAAPARPAPAGLAELIDILVVNAVEAEMLGGGTVETLADAQAAAFRLLDTYACVVVTAGGAGLAFASRDGGALQLSALKVKVESTHGAGDMFVGTLAASLARGVAIELALSHANAASGRLVATKEAERS